MDKNGYDDEEKVVHEEEDAPATDDATIYDTADENSKIHNLKAIMASRRTIRNYGSKAVIAWNPAIR